MSYRFNPPPNWPQPPAGFVPDPAWEPDPSWPPAPDGWKLWIEDADTPVVPKSIALRGRHAARPGSTVQTTEVGRPAEEAAATAPSGLVGGGLAIPSPREGRGLFGGKKRLENEVERLRVLVDQLGGMDALTIAAETDRLQIELDQARSALQSARLDVSNAQAELAAVRQRLLEYHDHPEALERRAGGGASGTDETA